MRNITIILVLAVIAMFSIGCEEERSITPVFQSRFSPERTQLESKMHETISFAKRNSCYFSVTDVIDSVQRNDTLAALHYRICGFLELWVTLKTGEGEEVFYNFISIERLQTDPGTYYPVVDGYCNSTDTVKYGEEASTDKRKGIDQRFDKALDFILSFPDDPPKKPGENGVVLWKPFISSSFSEQLIKMALEKISLKTN